MATILLTGYSLVDNLEAALAADGHTVVRGNRPRLPEVVPILDEAEWGVAEELDVIVTSSQDHLSGELIRRCPRLRGVVSVVIGVETVDVDAVFERGLIVANGAMPENYLGVAEATVTLIASLLLELPHKQQLIEGTPWSDRLPGRMVRHRTIGLIGYGQTARGVIDRLAGWEADILVHDPLIDEAAAHPHVKLVGLEELLTRSHVVSCHVPLNKNTWHMISDDELARMRPDACLINTSRGGVVDERALVNALEREEIWSAALDVFESEPLPDNSPLRTLRNVILTPHIAGHSHELYEAVPKVAAENVRRVLAGEPPLYLLGPRRTLEDWVYRGMPVE